MSSGNHRRLSASLQHGYTLLEILVALSIGLFMLGALLVIVQSNRSASNDQNKLAQLQDGERMAMTLMADTIQSAGYFPDPTANTSAALTADATFGLGQAIAGTYAAANPDQISVRYITAPGDTILNCSGVPNSPTSGANQPYVNTFSIVGGQLVCTMNNVAYTLVRGVTNLRVLYGVNTSGSGNSVDTYFNASQMSAANWNNVISVNVALTFTNPLYVAGQTVQQPTITVQRVIGILNKSGPLS